jgi:CO/xanthine dehydrogenase Mo-binding subunit
VEGRAVVTNKTPNAPYRGAGRPETVYAMDRIVDCLARELRMDPAELRRKNYLDAADLPYELHIPYRDGNPLVYDSGDFLANLEAALGAIGYDLLRVEQEALREAHLPRHRAAREGGHRAEGATVRMDAMAGRSPPALQSGQDTDPLRGAADALGVPLG